MKKKLFFVFLCVLLIAGCTKKSEIDYSKYAFTNTSWVRDSGVDIETIRFNEDGSFSYFCACGNPVNDSDLCDKYTYDDETKTIKLECFEMTDDIIENIKIMDVSNENLLLDFDGELRKFKRDN